MSDTHCATLGDHAPHAWGDLQWCPGRSAENDAAGWDDQADDEFRRAWARGWDEGFAARAEYDRRRDVPTDWPDLNPYRGIPPAMKDER